MESEEQANRLAKKTGINGQWVEQASFMKTNDILKEYKLLCRKLNKPQNLTEYQITIGTARLKELDYEIGKRMFNNPAIDSMVVRWQKENNVVKPKGI